MERSAEGEYRWVVHAVPDQRLRLRGRDEPAPTTRTSTTAPASPTTPTRSAPGSAPRRRPSGSPSGSRGARRCASSPAGHRPDARDRGPHSSSPATASTTCPTASSSPARSRTRSRARSRFHLPAMIGGREVAGVRLRFEAGKVVDATAERGEEFLIEMLDTDEGARRLGELGIGTNYGIDRGTREILLDEKIGGTVHLAVGRQLPRDRRRQRERRPQGHGLRPAPGRPDRGRRRGAAGGRRFAV